MITYEFPAGICFWFAFYTYILLFFQFELFFYLWFSFYIYHLEKYSSSSPATLHNDFEFVVTHFKTSNDSIKASKAPNLCSSKSYRYLQLLLCYHQSILSSSSREKFIVTFFSAVNLKTHLYTLELCKPQIRFVFSSQFKSLSKENNVSDVLVVLKSKISCGFCLSLFDKCFSFNP